MRLKEFHVDAGSPLVGKQLKETDIGQRTGAIVVGIQGQDGKPRIHPAASAGLSGVTIQQDDVLIVLGTDGQLSRLKAMV
jgi:K+/H+ antiporter YhaU regulatory subunit KhtT